MTKVQKKIVIVDDNNVNLVALKKTLRPFYEVYPVPSAKKMFELLESIKPDLILLDVDMPDMNGYEAAGRLKNDEAHKGIPIMFLSGRVDPTSEVFGLSMGALDYIHKPFVGELLLRRIDSHLSLIDHQKALEDRNLSRIGNEMQAPLNTIIEKLNNAMDTDDIQKIRDSLGMAIDASKQLLAIIGNEQ